jgi:hypothetical protein
MKPRHLLVLSAAVAVLPLLAVTSAQAQQRAVSGPRITLPSHSNHFSWERRHGFHGLHGGIFIVEREMPVIVEREVVREVAAANSGTPNTDVPILPRKPYVVGGTYASLPGGCMKMIEEGGSYYFCGGGEWYRQLGDGSGAKYRAVARP